MEQIQFLALGTDTEVFAIRKDDHSPVSSEGWVPGSKEAPAPMIGLPAGFAIQKDNVALEFNVPPARTRQEFSTNVGKALKYIKSFCGKRKLDFAVVSAMHFRPEDLMTPHAQLLGCEGDLNAWLRAPNPRPIPPFTLRTAAGHIHVSWEDPNDDQRAAMVKALDLFVTLPSLLVTEPNERRTLYGKAGACRLKAYGVEARSPDNFWIAKRIWREHVWDAVMNGIGTINRYGQLFVDEMDRWGNEIQHSINTHDRDEALRLMDIFEVPPYPIPKEQDNACESSV